MPFRPASARRARGFTLIELVITLAIVAILAAIAFPQFQEMTLRMASSTNTNNMVGALNIARSEAVKRGRPAAVVAIDGDWDKGWQVVVAAVDADGALKAPESPGDSAADCDGHLDNAADATSTVPLCMMHQPALEGGFTLLGKPGAGTEDSEVVFIPTGALLTSTLSFDFSLCRPEAKKDPTQSRRIHVAPSGTIETRRDTTGAPAGSCN